MAAIKNGGMSPARKKQYIILAGILLILVIISLIGGVLTTAKRPQVQQRPVSETRKNFGTTGDQVNPGDLWRVQEGAEISALREQIAALQKKQDEHDRAAKTKTEEAVKTEVTAPPPVGLPMQDIPLGQPETTDIPPPQERIKGIMRIDMGGNVRGTGQMATNADPVNGNQAVQDEQRADTYIPSGSFMRGVLFSGVDAPTGGQAQQNPHPVLIEVLDMASLPNNFRADYQKCRIIANAVGDLSSERAMMRLERMSCITADGAAIDIAVKGYITDQTGKAGVRGRLVSKQGSVLANALLSGMASGIGTAFAQDSYVNSVSPLGATQTIEDGKSLQAGAGQGIGTALQQLARYYIKTAENIFPVIEVDAGQPVDIVILQGFSVARKQ